MGKENVDTSNRYAAGRGIDVDKAEITDSMNCLSSKDEVTARFLLLQQQIARTKSEIYDTVRSQYSPSGNQFTAQTSSSGTESLFDPSARPPEEILSVIQNLESKLVSIVKNIDVCAENDVENTLHISLNKFRKLTKEIQGSETLLSCLHALIKIEKLLEEIDQAVEEEDYIEAAELLQSAQTSLAECPFSSVDGQDADTHVGLRDLGDAEEERDYDSPVQIVEILRTQCQKRRVKLVCRLSEILHSMIWIDVNERALKCSMTKINHEHKSAGENVDSDGGGQMGPTEVEEDGRTSLSLLQVLKAFQILQILEERMEAFSKTLRDSVFLPLLLSPETFPYIYSDKDGENKVFQCATSSTFMASALNERSIFHGNVEEERETRRRRNSGGILGSHASAKEEGGGGGGEAQKLSPTEMYSRLAKGVEFMEETLFPASSSSSLFPYCFNIIGRSLWRGENGLAAVMVKNLKENMPEKSSGFASYERIVLEGEQLEMQLKEMKFIDSKDEALTLFMKDISRYYAKKKRTGLLERARKLILEDFQPIVEVDAQKERQRLGIDLEEDVESTGSSMSLGKVSSTSSSVDARRLEKSKENQNLQLAQQLGNLGNVEMEELLNQSVLKIPDCRISKNVELLIHMVYQTFLEACSSTPLCANVLYHTARDIINLFRAIVPTLRKSQIEESLEHCMVFYNDCYYISYHLLTIGHQYRESLPSPLNQTATLIDLVPAIRELGQKALSGMQAKYRNKLMGEIEAFLPFSRFHEDPNAFQHIQGGVQSVTSSLFELAKVWKVGLPPMVYRTAVGILVESVLERVTDSVLVMKDISEKESHYIHSLFVEISQLEKLFSSLPESKIAEFVPSLSKFKTVGSLMVDSLVVITEKLRAEELSDLSADELIHLIKALFEASPKRKELIRLVEEAESVRLYGGQNLVD